MPSLSSQRIEVDRRKGSAFYSLKGKSPSPSHRNHNNHNNLDMLSFKVMSNLDDFLDLSPHCLHLLFKLTLLRFFHHKREMTSGDVGMVPNAQ